MWEACPALGIESALCQLADEAGQAFSSTKWPTVPEHLAAKPSSH